jgi:putative hemolysin
MINDELISENNLAKGLKLDQYKINKLAPVLMKLLKLKEVNKVYQTAHLYEGMDFVDKILDKLNIRYEVDEEDLKNIPMNEPFIIVANHPYGGIDGLIMLSLIARRRPDFKIMANYLLQQIPQISEHFVSVNPFDKSDKKSMNISGIKKAMKLIDDGHPVGIFPAGEVSSLKLNNFRVRDKEWNPVVGKMIIKSGVKVLPMYFSGNNSMMFNLLGLVHPVLRTAKLPSELFNKKKEPIQVRIGKPASIKSIQEFTDPEALLRFLRAKTYSLGSSLDVAEHFRFRIRPVLEQPQPIIDAVRTELLLEDIERIKTKKHLLFKQDQFEVYISGARFIPNILREISRLREVTFREVGEGTNHSFDSDEFDLHYKHLFIWDAEAKKIAGAYRIGLGDVLFRRYKKKGFYLNELFKISKEFNDILKQSLELGRSFVVKEYQRKPLSLMLLWKGVNEFLKQHDNRYRYLIGPVSISNSFSSLSKDLIVDYIRKHHFDDKLAGYVKPRKKYYYQHKGEGKELLKQKLKDIKMLDQMISDIETTHNKVPVLLKKYLKQNAKIIAFNIDPIFNNSLDGFLVLDLKEVPVDTFEMVS